MCVEALEGAKSIRIHSLGPSLKKRFDDRLEETYREEKKLIKKLTLKTRLPLQMKAVDFSYHEGKTILDDFSMCAETGAIISICGESGVGKSTVLNLICGFLHPDRDEILYWGNPTNQVNMQAVREKVAYVSQTPFFFNGTVPENLSYVRPDITLQDIQDLNNCTFIRLLTRLLEPGGGRIQVMGSEIANCRRDDLRKAVYYVEQNPYRLLNWQMKPSKTMNFSVSYMNLSSPVFVLWIDDIDGLNDKHLALMLSSVDCGLFSDLALPQCSQCFGAYRQRIISMSIYGLHRPFAHNPCMIEESSGLAIDHSHKHPEINPGIGIHSKMQCASPDSIRCPCAPNIGLYVREADSRPSDPFCLVLEASGKMEPNLS